ncbi:hypothetical protein [Pseudogracilibacillus auburnensis]|uniref:hypothetical protein n=1 Tax=Pseudogracilibacillus auburnensis TaxID=1494959 RepID=UPI001A95DDAC|nr:hypothetical protein [Pseudogracilibacillus auburnensis]MBO1004858.1 hypothetical protein [Pseudogracilibacillus auburnensis]
MHRGRKGTVRLGGLHSGVRLTAAKKDYIEENAPVLALDEREGLKGIHPNKNAPNQ